MAHRLSSQQLGRMTSELNELKNRLGINNQETDTYKQRIQKLLGENTALGDELRGAQENLRLSSGTLQKLQLEFKTVCGEYDETKHKLLEFEKISKKVNG